VPETLFEGAYLSEGSAELHVFLNWLEELKARVPGAR